MRKAKASVPLIYGITFTEFDFYFAVQPCTFAPSATFSAFFLFFLTVFSFSFRKSSDFQIDSIQSNANQSYSKDQPNPGQINPNLNSII